MLPEAVSERESKGRVHLLQVDLEGSGQDSGGSHPHHAQIVRAPTPRRHLRRLSRGSSAMRRQDSLLQRRSALGLASGGQLACTHRTGTVASAHVGATAHRFALQPAVGRSAPGSLLGSTTAHSVLGHVLRSGNVRPNAPQPPAAVPHQRQQHQQRSTAQAPAPSPEVQELLKRLKRANSAATVIREVQEWREAAPDGQQRRSLAVVGAAALQVLTRVLGPGTKPHRKQCEEVEAFVRSLVSELHGVRETLTLEHLSAVASSLVVLLPLLEAHGGEAAAGVQDASVTDLEGQRGGQEVQEEQPRCTCSPQQARGLAAALPELVQGIVSRQELPAVMVPVCQAYSSVLQLVQLTHTDPHGKQPGTLTLEGAKEVFALHASLSGTVLCAPRLARQLGHVGMADVGAAVQVAVQYRFALPAGLPSVPASFWEAVRKRVDELVWAARGGAAMAEGMPAAGAAAAGQASRGPQPLDAQSLVAILEAMGRDMAAKRREAERAPGGADKKPRGPGVAEAWLVDTTTLLLRSHQASMQDDWRGLVDALATAEQQLANDQQALEEAATKRRALQARQQQQQKQAAKRKKAKAGQQAEEQQQHRERTKEEKEMAEAEDHYGVCEVVVGEARDTVEDKRSELQKLGVVGLQQQLDTDALLQLARGVAEAAGGGAAAGGTGVGLGAALEGVVLGRLRELHPVHLVQALSALSATHHTLSQRAFEAVIQALVPDLGELSHVQQLDMLAALLGPGEQAPESKAGPFLAALTRAIASSGPGGLGAAPAELLFAVMNAAARWQVALGQEWVREVEQELARGLSVEGEGKTPAAVGAGAGAGVEQGPPAAVHSVGALRRQLMSDVFLPAVRRGQPFSKPDLFVLAVEGWRGRDSKPFPGLETATAEMLLSWVARRHGWQPTPKLHRAVEALAEAATRLQFTTSDELARVLLAASRALEATVPSGQHGSPAPVPDFFVPAVNQLLSMKPTVSDLASAVAALYTKPRTKPNLALLKRMLDMAQPQMAGARPLSYAQLLAGCVAAGWRPDDRWLAEHHAAAAKALRAAGTAVADVLLQLLSSLSGDTLSAQAASDPAYLAARNELLLETAYGLLRPTAVTVLAAKPDALAGAIRQVAVQGARPDRQWVARVVQLTQGLLPSLSPTGLASAAEGLAQLRAAPPVSFVDTLLVQAGKYDVEGGEYDGKQLGLLLGGVHALTRADRLSTEAAEAWGRLHAAFLPHCLGALATYTPAQAVMVATSVVAFQQAQPTTVAVDASWLAGLLDVLLRCRGSGAPPPPALLLDLLSMGSRVPFSTQDSSTSSQEGRARALLLSYVQQSLSDLASAATEDVPWPQLLRAALAAGVRPERKTLQSYSASLAQALYDTVRSKEPSEEQLSGAVRTLEEAITSALMPALPWAPEGDGGALLVSVLGAPELLRTCSPGQLALLCTYATQSGLGAKAPPLWRNVAAEVQRRGGATFFSAAAASDSLAIWYALEVAGCSVAAGGQRADMRTRLGQTLQELDAGCGADANGGGRHVAWAPTPLLAPQVLWVAYRLGGLSLVPQGAWAALWAALDAASTAEQLQQLLPYQLVQLVELRAAAAAAGLPLPPGPGGHIYRVLGTLKRQPKTAASETRLLKALVAARALAYLPAEELGDSWESLVSLSLPYFAKDWDADGLGGRVSSLSSADAAAWVSVMEKRLAKLGGPAIQLTLQQLQGIVKALAMPAAGPAPNAKSPGGGAGAAGLGLRETLTVTGTLLALSPPGPKTLEALAPLLQRVRVADDADLLAVRSVAQLTALASAIILAGGNQALPRPAAAALVRLLSCEGVLQQLPLEQVSNVVRFSLAGGQQDGGEELPGQLAEALVERLVSEGGMSPLRASVGVLACGASPDVVRQAARCMLQEQPAAFDRSPGHLLLDLVQLHECGITEPAGSLLDGAPVLGGGASTGAPGHTASGAAAAAPAAASEGALGQEQAATDGGGADTPLADYVLEALRQLAEVARQGGMEQGVGGDRDGVVKLLRTAAALCRQLEGLQVRRQELLESLHGIVDAVLHHPGVDLPLSGPAFAEMREGGWDEKARRIWSILELAFAFGCEDPCIGAGDAKTTGPGSAAPSYWQLLAAQYGTTGHQQRASSAHGTFLLSAAKALRLAVHLMNNAAVYQGCLEAADKDPAGEAPFIEVPVQDIVRHGLYGIKSLDSRQLALVTGLALDCEARRHELGLDEEASSDLKMRVLKIVKMLDDKVAAARDRLKVKIMKAPPSADALADRIRLLNLAFDAVEPAAMSAPRNHAGYGVVYERFDVTVAEIMCGVAAVMASTYPPLPEGVTHWDDLALLNSPFPLDEASLLDDLRRPPGARRFPLVLPTHLRPPAGGPPTPAQEAYVRSIAPAFMALRRLLQLAAVDGSAMRYAQTIAMKVPWFNPSYKGKPPTRWAVLMGLVVVPDATCQWLARREPARTKAGSRGGEQAVQDRAAELLTRVPWAGHTWEPLQRGSSAEDVEGVVRELITAEDVGGLVRKEEGWSEFLDRRVMNLEGMGEVEYTMKIQIPGELIVEGREGSRRESKEEGGRTGLDKLMTPVELMPGLQLIPIKIDGWWAGEEEE